MIIFPYFVFVIPQRVFDSISYGPLFFLFFFFFRVAYLIAMVVFLSRTLIKYHIRTTITVSYYWPVSYNPHIWTIINSLGLRNLCVPPSSPFSLQCYNHMENQSMIYYNIMKHLIMLNFPVLSIDQ